MNSEVESPYKKNIKAYVSHVCIGRISQKLPFKIFFANIEIIIIEFWIIDFDEF